MTLHEAGLTYGSNLFHATGLLTWRRFVRLSHLYAR